MNAASQSCHKARAGNAAPSNAKADKVMLYKARAGNAALAMLKLSKPNVKFCWCLMPTSPSLTHWSLSLTHLSSLSHPCLSCPPVLCSCVPVPPSHPLVLCANPSLSCVPVPFPPSHASSTPLTPTSLSSHTLSLAHWFSCPPSPTYWSFVLACQSLSHAHQSLSLMGWSRMLFIPSWVVFSQTWLCSHTWSMCGPCVEYEWFTLLGNLGCCIFEVHSIITSDQENTSKFLSQSCVITAFSPFSWSKKKDLRLATCSGGPHLQAHLEND